MKQNKFLWPYLSLETLMIFFKPVFPLNVVFRFAVERDCQASEIQMFPLE